MKSEEELEKEWKETIESQRFWFSQSRWDEKGHRLGIDVDYFIDESGMTPHFYNRNRRNYVNGKPYTELTTHGREPYFKPDDLVLVHEGEGVITHTSENTPESNAVKLMKEAGEEYTKSVLSRIVLAIDESLKNSKK